MWLRESALGPRTCQKNELTQPQPLTLSVKRHRLAASRWLFWRLQEIKKRNGQVVSHSTPWIVNLAPGQDPRRRRRYQVPHWELEHKCHKMPRGLDFVQWQWALFLRIRSSSRSGQVLANTQSHTMAVLRLPRLGSPTGSSSNLLQLCGEGLNLLFVRFFALVGLFRG